MRDSFEIHVYGARDGVHWRASIRGGRCPHVLPDLYDDPVSAATAAARAEQVHTRFLESWVFASALYGGQ